MIGVKTNWKSTSEANKLVTRGGETIGWKSIVKNFTEKKNVVNTVLLFGLVGIKMTGTSRLSRTSEGFQRETLMAA